MSYADGYFGTTADYNAHFRDAFQVLPSYVAAGASATSYSLASALQEAFSLCTFHQPQMISADMLLFDQSAIQCVDPLGAPVTGVGYNLVLDSLSRQKLNTFFGEVCSNHSLTFYENDKKNIFPLPMQCSL